jgi:hypothetical protein
MTIEERHLRVAAFLKVHVFHGMHNLNDGYDTLNSEYFKEAEFRVVLQRCTAMGIGLYGIEPWKNGTFFDVVTLDKSIYQADDPDWYFQAFEKFVALEENLSYSASFYVPIKLVELEHYPSNPHYIFLKGFIDERKKYWKDQEERK